MDAPSIFGLLVLLGLVLFVGKQLYGILVDIRKFFMHLFGHIINRHFIIRNIKPEYKKILTDCFTYYRNLTRSNQRLFQKRVQKFIDKKKFIPGEGVEEVTPEMKALVAASAVQLTFGLPQVYFKHFDEIQIHGNAFFSEAMFQLNAGEVHKQDGLIVLSWRDFLEGYLDPNNARNVGLHEMAHALRLENMIKNEEYGYFDWDGIHLFNEHTVIESEKIIKGDISIFREYAAQHYQEFFAVLIEVFFEQTQQLFNYNHELYTVTCRLLKQDPRYPNKRTWRYLFPPLNSRNRLRFPRIIGPGMFGIAPLKFFANFKIGLIPKIL